MDRPFCWTCNAWWKWQEPDNKEWICPPCKSRLIFKTYSPDDAQRLNRQGWVLRKVEPNIERPNTEPRKYILIGKHKVKP